MLSTKLSQLSCGVDGPSASSCSGQAIHHDVVTLLHLRSLHHERRTIKEVGLLCIVFWRHTHMVVSPDLLRIEVTFLM